MFLSNRAALDVTIDSETLQSVPKSRAPWKKHKNAKQMPAQFPPNRPRPLRKKLFLQNKYDADSVANLWHNQPIIPRSHRHCTLS